MIGNAWTQVGVLLFVLTFLVKPLGHYVARIARGDLSGPLRRLAAIEYVIYRLAGIAPDDEMHWKRYAIALVAAAFIGQGVVQGFAPDRERTDAADGARRVAGIDQAAER